MSDDGAAGDPGTVYNGTTICADCGALVNPVESLFSAFNLCTTCRRRKIERHVKNGMSDGHRP